MAKNKITFEREYDDGMKRCVYRFTGSQRQPTLTEARNFIQENRLGDDMQDYFGIAHVVLKTEEWIPPEEDKTLELWGYDGGSGDGTCPVCGHERDMGGNVCPVCLRGWE